MQQKPPIVEAAEFGDIKRIKELLKSPNLDINATNAAGFTAATIAAMHNNYEMLRILVQAGADLHKRAKNNQNAIDWIRAHNNTDMLKLIEKR